MNTSRTKVKGMGIRLMKRKFVHTALLLTVMMIIPLDDSASGQTEDLTPPQLTAFDFTPKNIDTTAGPASVTVSFQVTDDLSGATTFDVQFGSPGGGQRGVPVLFAASTDFTGSGALSFPQFSEAGTWVVLQVFVRDNVGNTRYYTRADLTAQGWPTELTVLSAQDTTPPNLTAFDFSPKAIDTSSGPASVTVSFTVTDDISGATTFDVQFGSPLGGQRGAPFLFSAGTEVTGSGALNFPQFSEAGTWVVLQLFIRDAVGNTRYYSAADLTALGFPTELHVQSAQDITPPILTAFDFSPKIVDASTGPASVIVSFTVTDDISGATTFDVQFGSPLGGQRGVPVLFSAATSTTASGVLNFPQFSETGTWVVLQLFLRDAVGNTRYYTRADLTALGFPTELVIIPSSELTALGPAQVWIGLKNSDDVGTKFDLLAEIFKNNALVGSGQLNAVAGGSSGFNNAILRTINLALASPVSVGPGDTLSIRLSVRIAVGVSGHRSGTARLWFNDAAANSRFGATIGGVASDYLLLDGFTLGAAAGTGPKKTIDVFVDRAAGGNPFKPFGAWSKTF